MLTVAGEHIRSLGVSQAFNNCTFLCSGQTDISLSGHRHWISLKNMKTTFAPHSKLYLYFAGMDPHEGSGFGELPGIATDAVRQRDSLVLKFLRHHNIPVAIAIGAGYPGPGLDRHQRVELHRMTIELASAEEVKHSVLASACICTYQHRVVTHFLGNALRFCMLRHVSGVA